MSGLTPVLVLLLIVVWIVPVFAEENGNGTEHSKALVLLYLVGSDLESGAGHPGGGTGTTDLTNLLAGYGNTSQEDLNIVVAYGGADIPGWRGMTIVPVQDLIRDATDGIFGNEQIGEMINTTADMGSAGSLSAFLSQAGQKYSGDTTYLFFWNHGGGFEGFGYDEVTGNHLSITDIVSVLQRDGRTYDLIGFDACLMAGLEIAQALSPYAHYLVASEEISAGGWGYNDWIATISRNPGQDPAITGRNIIDSFFLDPEPSGNTASLVDLTRLEPVLQSLDELGTLLNGTIPEQSSIVPVAKAYEKTTRFGENSAPDQHALKVDLATLAGYLAETIPEAKIPVENLKKALNEAVIYEHHDELMSNATGLSIADPLTLSDPDYREIATTLSMTPGWDAFIGKVRTHLKEEIAPPDIVSVGTNTFNLKNPTGFESVSVGYYAVDAASGDLLQLGSMPSLIDDNGTYTLPDWDGEWSYLIDSVDPNTSALLDLYYGDTTGTGISKFISQVDFIRNGTLFNTQLYSYLDPDSNWTRYSFRPYFLQDDGVVFSRSGFTPMPGDSLITYASGYSTNGTEMGLLPIGEMTLNGTPELYSGLLPDGDYAWALQAEVPGGSSDISDIRLLSIKDGVVIRKDQLNEQGDFAPAPNSSASDVNST